MTYNHRRRLWLMSQVGCVNRNRVLLYVNITVFYKVVISGALSFFFFFGILFGCCLFSHLPSPLLICYHRHWLAPSGCRILSLQETRDIPWIIGHHLKPGLSPLELRRESIRASRQCINLFSCPSLLVKMINTWFIDQLSSWHGGKTKNSFHQINFE